MSQHFVPLSRKTSFAIGRSQRPSIASINDTTMEEDVDDKVGAEQNSTRALKRAFKRLSSSGARKSETEATPLLAELRRRGVTHVSGSVPAPYGHRVHVRLGAFGISA